MTNHTQQLQQYTRNRIIFIYSSSARMPLLHLQPISTYIMAYYFCILYDFCFIWISPKTVEEPTSMCT